MRTHLYSFITVCSLLLASVLHGSCTENEMSTYQNDPAIYFSYDTDSISYSFFSKGNDVKRDTVHIKIQTMGLPTDFDRPVKIVQINTEATDAAIAGTHYLAFDDPAIADSFIIKAGEVSANIPVVVLRDASLNTTTKRLELEISDNEYFRKGIDEWQRYLVTITDKAQKPAIWDDYWASYLGSSWSANKMRFAQQATGYTNFEETPDMPGYASYIGTTCKQKLLEYNSNPDNPPILDELTGKPISFDL